MYRHHWGIKSFGLLLLGIMVFLWLTKAEVMAYYLSAKLRVPVSIAWMSTNPREVSFHDFRVDNPKSFKHSYALQGKILRVTYDWDHLLANPMTIDRIWMKDVFLNIELASGDNTDNNWSEIASKMEEPKSLRQIEVKHLIFDHLLIVISGPSLPGGELRSEVDHLELEDISGKTGFPTERLIHELFGGLGIEQYIEGAFNPRELFGF
jgi:hypothetical protein